MGASPKDIFADIPDAGSGFSVATSSLIASGASVIVGYSGGADSTAALLWAIGKFGRDRVAAAHYHHGVRGRTADADLEHCRNHAGRLGVRFLSETAFREGPRDENSLRRARLAFFMRAAREAEAQALIQGHHADDVAETLLMRIGRGSGAGGLSAPRPVSRLPDGTPILRPLLKMKKSVLASRLRLADEAWVEDETNGDPAVATRNRLRANVMPAWRDALPADAVAGAARTRALLEEDDDALNDWASAVFSAHADTPYGPIVLKNLPRAVCRRVLRLFLADSATGSAPEAAAFEALLDAALAGGSHALSLGANRTVRAKNHTVRIDDTTPLSPIAKAVLPCPGMVFFPDGSRISASESLPEKADPSTEAFIRMPDASVLFCGPVVNGERYVPAGSPGSQKLREAMTNRKVPVRLRDTWPVIRDGETAVWFPGLLSAESHRPAAGEKRALRLTWSPAGAAWPAFSPT